jgi:hypothetical protein
MFHRSRYLGILALVLIALCLVLWQGTGGRAGSLPNLLDDNRGSQVLADDYSAAVTTASSLVLAPNPLTFVYEPISISGRVLAHPSIHNLYLDDDWDSHNPGAPTVEQLDAFTQDLVNSHYFDGAAQYGVGNATFTGSNQRSTLCDPLRNTLLALRDGVSLQSWIVCEASFNPAADFAGIPPGTLPALTGVPQADNNTLYVVYLPAQFALLGNEGCSYGGYHFFSVVPAVNILSIPPTFSQTFAYAVIPTGCNNPTPQPSQTFLDSVTQSASHEIIEASTDPLWGLGWINDSPIFQVNGPIEGPLGLFNQFVGNINFDFSVGEAADICSVGVGLKFGVATGAIGPAPAFLHPTSPLYLSVNDSSLNNMISVVPYWSNANNGACVPGVPVTTASLSPQPNVAGWNNSDVMVTLTSSEPGGSVKQISYSSTGAQTTASTTVSVSSTSVVISNEGVTTLSFFGTDNAGNVESAKSVTILLDKTPPSVNCGAADGLWHAADVSIACTGGDTGSGLANASDAIFSLSTSVPAGTETSNAATGTHPVCDVAGNCATAGPVLGNMVDKKPPSISISSPTAGGSYLLNQTVSASYSCADGGSGVATCSGTVASGSPIDTASAGSKTFLVNATDKVGNVAAPQSVSYSVSYAVCLFYDPTRAVQSGSTVPLKIQLCDANNSDASSPSVVVHGVSLLQVSTNASEVLQASGNANPDNDFRFDSTLGPTGGYVFNLSTKGLTTGSYALTFTAGTDPSPHILGFQVR